MNQRIFLAIAGFVMVLLSLALFAISATIALSGNWQSLRESGVPNPALVGVFGLIAGLSAIGVASSAK